MKLDVIADVNAHDQSPGANLIRDAKRSLQDAIQTRTVREMVDAIGARLGRTGSIRRLRIFAHGRQGMFSLTPLSGETRRLGLGSFANTDLLGVVMITPSGQMTNEDQFGRLRSRFGGNGFIELHCCEVAGSADGRDDRLLLARMADLTGVPVKGSAALQYVGGGLEGNVIVVDPLATRVGASAGSSVGQR